MNEEVGGPSGDPNRHWDHNRRQKPRRGIHIRIAWDIEAKFASGVFDQADFEDHFKDAEYDTPPPYQRKAFAETWFGYDVDTQRLQLWSMPGFEYVMYSRQVTCLSEMRHEKFCALKAARVEEEWDQDDAEELQEDE